ncbi:MAG TPA: NUDIX domain-containing protein, partial [Thermoanaerobaculia bacterium]|nr:NUDIX domain-containing protein [Thermoanaerobaculia bacterium]
MLVAQRPAGKHLAGFWEFPGGKSDPGETPLDALRRELAEELGIRVETAEPLIAVPWTYPGKQIVLDAWIV